jgi:hypothetical protein
MPAQAGIQHWVPAFAGTSGREVRFKFQTARLRCASARQANAPPPVLFGRRRVRLHSNPPPGKNRGRAGRQGSRRTRGPRRLATSRLAEVRNAASPPKPKASRARCLRLAPHRPRWTSHFRRPSLRKSAYPPLLAQADSGMPVTGCRHPPSRGPATHGWCAGTDAAWTAGRFAASPTKRIPRPPLPAPRLETLIRHPSVARAGCTHDKCAQRGGDKFLSLSARAVSARTQGASRSYLFAVIAGFDPAIHEPSSENFRRAIIRGQSSWMRGSSPRMTPNMSYAARQLILFTAIPDTGFLSSPA